ncbi:MAG: hypothetical protein JWP25_2515 [Bradyrhizobium sp.]|jgi:hypothetical protein|nr:hypothetical protein [Bradyrhizobium sp.]
MSRVERDLYPGYSHDDRCVCANCFEDEDLQRFIRHSATQHKCSFCGSRAKSAPLEEVAGFIEGRMEEFYGKAVEQLPYESREGGYQGAGIPTPMICYSAKLVWTFRETMTARSTKRFSMKLATMSGVTTTGSL